MYIQDSTLVITVAADALIPNGARPSADTVLTSKVMTCFLPKFVQLLMIKNIKLSTFLDQMTSVKMSNEIPWKFTAFGVSTLLLSSLVKPTVWWWYFVSDWLTVLWMPISMWYISCFRHVEWPFGHGEWPLTIWETILRLLFLAQSLVCLSLLNSFRDHFVYVPSQWEMTLQCNVVSYRLGAFRKWSQLIISQDVLILLIDTDPKWQWHIVFVFN